MGQSSGPRQGGRDPGHPSDPDRQAELRTRGVDGGRPRGGAGADDDDVLGHGKEPSSGHRFTYRPLGGASRPILGVVREGASASSSTTFKRSPIRETSLDPTHSVVVYRRPSWPG